MFAFCKQRLSLSIQVALLCFPASEQGRDVNVIWGVDIAVATMYKKEISQFLFSPQYAYGEMGCPPRIPPDATSMRHVLLTFMLTAFVFDQIVAHKALTDLEKRLSFDAPLVWREC